MVKVKVKGRWYRTYKFLDTKNLDKYKNLLDKYGKIGVQKVSEATPVDSGLTASSWYYEITEKNAGRLELRFSNSNVKDGVPIAIILQYGHATRNGSWVEGRDYINPALVPVFDDISNAIGKELSKS